jgi:class 3 adenylate cyclase
MAPDDAVLYKERFENLFRVAKKITSCLNIGEILEQIRDEVKTTVPHASEACLILVDPDAPNYTRPLHCVVAKENINCHMCKRGRALVQRVLGQPMAIQCAFEDDEDSSCAADDAGSQRICEVALPIYDAGEPLAVLNVVTERGAILSERDIVLLLDLAELATNTIVNAKKYSKMAREKLSVERILGHIRPFVPETVQRIVEKNPDAPALNKQETDVSILFLDVADYTRITETLTLDKVNFIIEKYFSSFLDIICAHGGDVNETAGDGLMAIFQGEKEDHALNATQAALEIRRQTGQINTELEGLFYPIVVNMGVNSGGASVGMSRFLGESGCRMTFTASGTVTNLASRLASAAVNGDILIGPETAARIRDRITLFDRGAMQFKNIRQPVPVFSVIPGNALDAPHSKIPQIRP